MPGDRQDTVTVLRAEARRLFGVACAAADPATALDAALIAHPPPPPDDGGRTIAIALGKAAVAMARAWRKFRPDGVLLVITNPENAAPLAGAEVHAAAHPIPDARAEAAARRAESLLATTTPRDRVVALISGGGSALMLAPLPGLTLDDKIAVNRLLLAHGFDITATNLVRQALSRVKGGGLARAAAPAPLTAYILSDVIGDDLRVIASGPSVAPIGSRKDAAQTLHKAGLWEELPARVRAHLETPAPVLPPLPKATNHLIGANGLSLAAARQAAKGALIIDPMLTGDVAQAAARIVVQSSAQGPDAATLIWGGETTVHLRGNGRGGRNQELALRVAQAMPDLGRDWAFLSGGTDGRDGPTEAAGGLVDAGTWARIGASGCDAQALLDDNDSHAALALAGDLLVTGPTGTNVADVQILTLGPRRAAG